VASGGDGRGGYAALLHQQRLERVGRERRGGGGGVGGGPHQRLHLQGLDLLVLEPGGKDAGGG
jgi:hypothetical protein